MPGIEARGDVISFDDSRMCGSIHKTREERSMSMTNRVVRISLALIVVATLGLTALGAAAAQPGSGRDSDAPGGPAPGTAIRPDAPVAQGIQIPVIVNVYPGGVVDPQAIEEANRILKQAGMKLVVVKTNQIGENSGGAGQWGGDNGADGGTAGDGTFTRGERDSMRTFGGKELDKLPNHKGIKISFGDVPVDGSGTPGVSVHRDPTIIVRDRGNSSNTGQTIAHEIGHVMTLGEGHKIDSTTNADEGGHAPDKPGTSGRGNIMAPSDYRAGTHLTPDQIAEMQRRKYVHGKCATQWDRAYPATKDPQQFGTITDNANDQGAASPIYDLDAIFLTSLIGAPNVEAQLTVAGLLPTDVDISAIYALGLDVDADMSTGILYGDLPGVDRIVSCILEGNIGLGTFVVSGSVYDTIGGVTTPLPEPPAVVTDSAYVDLNEPGEPAATSCLMQIPTPLLGLVAVEAPVVATTGDLEVLYDSAFLLFDSERWLHDPTLTTLGTGVPVPGAPYPVEISGLAPEIPFTLYLDDLPVLTGVTSASGAFSGAFVFPEDLPAGRFYFLTAQDDTGEFAYNITCPGQADHVIHLPVVMKTG